MTHSHSFRVQVSLAMPRRSGRRSVGGGAVARSADVENVDADASAANAAASALDGYITECVEVAG